MNRFLFLFLFLMKCSSLIRVTPIKILSKKFDLTRSFYKYDLLNVVLSNSSENIITGLIEDDKIEKVLLDDEREITDIAIGKWISNKRLIEFTVVTKNNVVKSEKTQTIIRKNDNIKLFEVTRIHGVPFVETITICVFWNLFSVRESECAMKVNARINIVRNSKYAVLLSKQIDEMVLKRIIETTKNIIEKMLN
jgi:hypothetical protein